MIQAVLAKKALAFLTKPSVIIAVVLTTAVGVQTWRLKSAHTAIAEANAALVSEQAKGLVCESGRIELEGRVAEQNAAIRKLEKQAAELSKRSSRAAEEALAAPLPPTVGPGPEEMNKWLERS